MTRELSKIERATLHKMQERGGALRIDVARPEQRGLVWLLDHLAQRGYVQAGPRSGTIVLYQLQPRAVAVAMREQPERSLALRR